MLIFVTIMLKNKQYYSKKNDEKNDVKNDVKNNNKNIIREKKSKNTKLQNNLKKISAIV